MPAVTIEEAQAKLPDLIDRLAPGEELAITRNNQTIARLIGQSEQKPRPIPGRGKGKVIIISEDDEHLKDFEDYMP